MFLQVQIDTDPVQLVNARSLTFDFDANIMRIHLDDEANEYKVRELFSTGFPQSSITVIINQQE